MAYNYLRPVNKPTSLTGWDYTGDPVAQKQAYEQKWQSLLEETRQKLTARSRPQEVSPPSLIDKAKQTAQSFLAISKIGSGWQGFIDWLNWWSNETQSGRLFARGSEAGKAALTGQPSGAAPAQTFAEKAADVAGTIAGYVAPLPGLGQSYTQMIQPYARGAYAVTAAKAAPKLAQVAGKAPSPVIAWAGQKAAESLPAFASGAVRGAMYEGISQAKSDAKLSPVERATRITAAAAAGASIEAAFEAIAPHVLRAMQKAKEKSTTAIHVQWNKLTGQRALTTSYVDSTIQPIGKTAQDFISEGYQEYRPGIWVKYDPKTGFMTDQAYETVHFVRGGKLTSDLKYNLWKTGQLRDVQPVTPTQATAPIAQAQPAAQASPGVGGVPATIATQPTDIKPIATPPAIMPTDAAKRPQETPMGVPKADMSPTPKIATEGQIKTPEPPERTTLRKQVFAVAKQYDISREERMKLAKEVAGNQNLQSISGLSLEQLQSLVNRLRDRGAQKAKPLFDLAQKQEEVVEKTLAKRSKQYKPAMVSDYYKILGKTPPEGFVDEPIGEFVDIDGEKVYLPRQVAPEEMPETDVKRAQGRLAITDMLRSTYRTLPRPFVNEATMGKKVSDIQANADIKKINNILKGEYDPAKLVDALEGKEVQGAEKTLADRIRKDILDPLFERAVSAGVLKPEQYVKNYFSHMREFAGKQEFAPEWLTDTQRWFTKSRTGGKEYRRDVENVLKIYIRSMAKAVHLDPVISKWKDTVNKMPTDKRRLALEFINVVYGRPAGEERMLNELINRATTQVLGKEYKGRHLQKIANTMISYTVQRYMGLNIGSALKNFTQQLFTIAELAKNTNPNSRAVVNPLRGFKYIAQAKMRRVTSRQWEQINKQFNTLLNQRTYHEGLDIIADYENWATKILNKTSNVTMKMFEYADKENVSNTFLACLQAALDDGMPLADALDYANEATLRIQFPYDPRKAPIGYGPIGRTASLFTSFAANFADLMGDWRDWRIVFLFALLAGTERLFRQIGLAVKINALETMKGHLLVQFMSGEDAAVVSTIKDIQKLSKKLQNGDTDSWVETFVEVAKMMPGGTQANRIDRFVKASKNHWQVRDAGGNLLYRFEVGDNPWEKELYKVTGVPGEAIRSLFGQTAESEERWQRSKKYTYANFWNAMQKDDKKKAEEIAKGIIEDRRAKLQHININNITQSGKSRDLPDALVKNGTYLFERVYKEMQKPTK